MGSSIHHGLLLFRVVLLLLFIAANTSVQAFFTIDEDNDDPSCGDQLAAADADQNDELNATEYLQFLRLRSSTNNNDTYSYDNSAESLTDAQQIIFQTTACSLCLLQAMDLACCDPPVWPIEGASAAARTSDQTLVLDVLCALSDGTTVLDSVWQDVVDYFSVRSIESDGDGAPTGSPMMLTPDNNETNDLINDCGMALHQADTNQNGELSESEYVQFVQTSYYDTDEDCQITTDMGTLTYRQAAMYSAMACEECRSSSPPEDDCDKCDKGPIDIGGADLAAENRTAVQSTRLETICNRARTTAALECEIQALLGPSSTSSPTAAELTPVDEDNVVNATCATELNSADADGDEFLNRTEYADLVGIRYRGDLDCALPPDNVLLSEAQEQAFQRLACARCWGELQDCDVCGTDAARVAIRGAADPSAAQLVILSDVCSAMDYAAAMDCALRADGVNGSVPSASPVATDTPVAVVNATTTPTVAPVQSPTVSPTTDAPTIAPTVAPVTETPVTLAPVEMTRSPTVAPATAAPVEPEQTLAPTVSSRPKVIPIMSNSGGRSWLSSSTTTSTLLLLLLGSLMVVM